MTYREIIQSWTDKLPIYPAAEAEIMLSWLFEHHLQLKWQDWNLDTDPSLFPKELMDDFARLQTGEPIQYILGQGHFYGREFLVNKHTLIPRNETEELVHLILKENKLPNLKILDIGTGTGCIPITLSLEMTAAYVYGIDISQDALTVAQQNATLLDANVSFSQCDILRDDLELVGLDIIVSNPPYIPVREKKDMHINVLEHEPHLALFVPNEDPLVFYRAIAEKGLFSLKPGGKIYFEIWEKAGNELLSLLKKLGYNQTKLHQDLNGKDRMVSGIK